MLKLLNTNNILPKKRLKVNQNRSIYPQPCNTFEEFQKLFNSDLQDISVFELLQEQARLYSLLPQLKQNRIIHITSNGSLIVAGDWLPARLQAIKKEIRARGRGV